MAAIQSLKKQLRGIRSTQKLTKAMKTVSTVKFSKLNGMYGGYAPYGEQCNALLEQYGGDLAHTMGKADPSAPEAVVVLAGNKGLCGSFNAQVLQYAKALVEEKSNCVLIPCGKKADVACRTWSAPCLFTATLDDLPTYEQASQLFDRLLALRKEGTVSHITVVYPRYRNMMIQQPSEYVLFDDDGSSQEDLTLFVPDRATVEKTAAQTVYRGIFYHLLLQTAVGAQAATLMTMRSAYDTATEYCVRLEGQINRMRQSAVTADVIETSAEREN